MVKKIVAVILIAAGVLGLMYGKVNYTKEKHQAKIGPVELTVKDKQSIAIPVWASVGVIVAGVGILLVRK
ncbi:MAG TPA: hypothetical protein VFS47_04205 [Steroidobacteraceae bacterium]|nr:hypothetical protein [Steroidobacteraceae bacterium]